MSKTLEDIKIQAAVSALVSNGLNQSKAARQLDISRGALRTYLASYVNTADGASTKNLNAEVLTKHLS